jgi:putative transposase
VAKRPAVAARLHDIPDDEREEAARRQAVIQPLAARQRNSLAAVKAAGAQLGLKAAQVYRLIANHRANPTLKALVRDKPGPRQGSRRLDARIESIIEEQIDRVYMKPERRTVVVLHEEIWAACKEAGLRPPSLKAVTARVNARPERQRTRAREGHKAARDKHALAYPGELRPSAPLEIVEIDHTRADVILVSEIDGLPIGRPYLTTVEDVYSRCILGFNVSLDPPSSANLASALVHALKAKDEWLTQRNLKIEWPLFGKPQRLHLDHGSDFISKAFSPLSPNS